MLDILEDDERNVIRDRHGLADGLTRTVTAVAAQMKQTKAWVRSQECKALRKLRRPYSEDRYKEINKEVKKMLTKIGFKTKKIPFVPMSGFKGDNLIEESTNMPWYSGFTVKPKKKEISGKTL